MHRMKANTDAQILALIDTSGGPDACHPWQGAFSPTGYGRVKQAGRTWRVHRWMLSRTLNRELQPEELVCHHCDNPACCNVRHLYVGSSASNAQDRERRGRGVGAPVMRRALEVCSNGHPYDELNTYFRKGNLHRTCRVCNLAAVNRYNARKREKVG